MGTSKEDRRKAAQLPDGDVIRILLTQHARIRELFDEVEGSSGVQRREAFEELRALLALHETAEEIVLRPVTEKIAPPGVAESRNADEQEANQVLTKLEDADPDSDAFSREVSELKSAVDAHAESEESEEFPVVLERCDLDQRRRMGRRLEAVEKLAPTRPHPSTAGSPAKQWTVGPFAALIDRAKDAINKVRD
ncbi:MAG TPA: hemerythrin domain-containing protein [Microlunatus sp.]